MYRYVHLPVALLSLCFGWAFVGSCHPLCAQESAADTTGSVTVGDAAPDFTAKTQDGEFKLSDHLGKNVVIVFVRAHW